MKQYFVGGQKHHKVTFINLVLCGYTPSRYTVADDVGAILKIYG